MEWQVTADVEMSVHGYIAMALGILFSIVVGCGLMALMFYSSRRGYDEPPDLNPINDDLRDGVKRRPGEAMLLRQGARVVRKNSRIGRELGWIV